MLGLLARRFNHGFFMTKPEPELDFGKIETSDPYDGFLHRTRAEAEKIAALQGCIVRAPLPKELFVDIDTPEQYETFLKQMKAFPKGLIVKSRESSSPSGTPGKLHVVVTLSRSVTDEVERVLLQALLGSDPMRELLSWRRIEDGSDNDAISLFFEKPGWEASVDTFKEAVLEPTAAQCQFCSCALATQFGGLEEHDGDCPYLPL